VCNFGGGAVFASHVGSPNDFRSAPEPPIAARKFSPAAREGEFRSKQNLAYQHDFCGHIKMIFFTFPDVQEKRSHSFSEWGGIVIQIFGGAARSSVK